MKYLTLLFYIILINSIFVVSPMADCKKIGPVTANIREDYFFNMMLKIHTYEIRSIVINGDELELYGTLKKVSKVNKNKYKNDTCIVNTKKMYNIDGFIGRDIKTGEIKLIQPEFIEFECYCD